MKYVPGPTCRPAATSSASTASGRRTQTGRGIFRTRATTKIEQLNARKTGIVVTELPYSVGPEKVIARIKDLVQAKKLTGISDLKDLTDRNRGLNLVIEVRAGFNPEAVLAELYRLTPMEETFGINNVALVDGQPRTLGLRELLTIYVDHRLDVTRRRSEFRRRKRQERLHLVDGILIALLNIDEVIQVIRTSDDSAEAKRRLQPGLRPVRDPGAVHPRHPAAPPDQVRQARAGARAGDPAGRDRRADRDPGERREAPRPGRRRDGRPREEVRHPAPHGADGGGRGGHRRRPARGGRRPVPGGAVGDRPAGPHPAGKSRSAKSGCRTDPGSTPPLSCLRPRGHRRGRGHHDRPRQHRRGHLGRPDDPGQRHRDPPGAVGRGGLAGRTATRSTSSCPAWPTARPCWRWRRWTAASRAGWRSAPRPASSSGCCPSTRPTATSSS